MAIHPEKEFKRDLKAHIDCFEDDLDKGDFKGTLDWFNEILIMRTEREQILREKTTATITPDDQKRAFVDGKPYYTSNRKTRAREEINHIDLALNHMRRLAHAKGLRL